MFIKFQNFQITRKDKCLTMQNENFNYIIQDFSFYFYTKENTEIQQLLIQENKYPIIIIDEHTEGGNLYYILCFDTNLLIIKENDLIQFKSYFQRNSDSTLYYISKHTKQFLNQFSEMIRQNQIKIESQSDFFKNEIYSFLQQFSINKKNKSKFNINEINYIWLIINRSISGLLIQKAHYKNTMNQIEDSKNFYKNQRKEIEIKNDEYINLSIIHHGGSSIIHLIYYIKTEDIFALKELFDYENQKHLFERERENYLQLRHPFLLQFYGTAQIKDHKGLLIEYINGHSLNQIKKMKLSNEYKIKIIFEIIMIIKFIHDQGFVFRDLKPNNVMIDSFNSAVLIDLDRMIKLENSNDEVRTKDFSSPFFAPEIVSNSFNYEADTYSLGLLIYYIFSENDFKVEIGKKPNLNYFCLIEYPVLKEICEHSIEIDQLKRKKFDEIIFEFYFEYTKKYKNIFLYGLDRNIMYFFIAAELNDSLACLFLGSLFLKNNLNLSMNYFQKSADLNNSVGQMSLGILYLEQGDIQKAIHYLTLASNNNFKYAQFALACIYKTSKFNHFDKIKSHHYFIKSESFKYSLLELGTYYFRHGFNDIAIYYFTEAHKQNVVEAQMYLGYIYLTIDINKSIYYLTFAANNGDDKSQNLLGMIYLQSKNVPHDIDKSIFYLTLSAHQKNKNSLFTLGFIYRYYKDDPKKAFFYLNEAAKQNHADAFYHLGILYYDKDTPYFDINKSIDCFTQGSKRNNQQSSFRLGIIYSENKIVPMNMNKAIYYYKNSSSFNNQYAKNNLAMILQNGIYVKKNLWYAIELLNEAIRKKNDGVSMYNLAYIYFFDNDIEKNIDKAIDLLIMSYKTEFPKDISLPFLGFCLVDKLKYDSLIYKKVNDEILKYDKNAKDIVNDVFANIYHIFSYYNQYYNYFKVTNYMYNIGFKQVKSSSFFCEKIISIDTKKSLMRDIDKSFYEGFYN